MNIKCSLVITLFIGIVLFPIMCFAQPVEFHGFIEASYGVKLSNDTTKHDAYNLLEQRFQFATNYYFEGENYLADKGAVVNFKGDFLIDEYFSGRTDFLLREANLLFTPFDFLDAKIGRQILTWGTGDYLFINDMFPKDYVSFFAGRDDEYLKKPSNAIKFSVYPQQFSVDFVVIPYFTPNTFAEGDRLSFFDSFQGEITGTDSRRQFIEPPFQMSNNQYALRVYRNFNSNEAAFYYFRGFDKNPRSYKNEAAQQLFYERIDVYGASIRGPFCSGITNVEFGYSRSRDDSQGNNRLIENSIIKIMAGYSKDLGNDLQIGFQYLYEQKLNYQNYIDNLLPGDYFWDEYRHLVTNRITKLLLNQNLTVSLFVFYSPSDKDGYIRPSVGYNASDRLNITLGADLPWGEDETTEFGQMKKNKNVFFRIRYSF